MIRNATNGHNSPRRERHKVDADTEDDGRYKLEGNGNTPCGLALMLATNEVRAIIDPKRHHNAEGDSELLEGDKTAADFWGSQLGAVVVIMRGGRRWQSTKLTCR